MRSRTLFAFVAAAVLAAGACNSDNPSAPSEISAATIQGTVISSPVPANLRVSVGTSSNSVAVDGSGAFTLNDVPPGNVELRFTTSGFSSSLALPSVQPKQTVTITVSILGSSVVLESARRVLGTAEELQGRVESLHAGGAFTVAGRTITTDTSTRFLASGQQVTFGTLAVGLRVSVSGQMSPSALLASLVDIQTPAPGLQFTISGLVTGFSGTSAAFEFTLAGKVVKGDGATQFAGGQFNELANDLAVDVTATQQQGFIQAIRLTITSEALSFTGRIISLLGTPPELTMVVTGRTVQTSAFTDVRRKGQPQNANTIATGQTLDVSGRLRTDGTVAASSVNILVDAPGGTFRMEGTIDALSGTCPQVKLTVSSYEITTDAATTFTPACGGLALGDRVEIIGVVQNDLTVVASSVTKK